MFPKLPSLLFWFLINSSRFTMFTGTRRRHPKLSAILGLSSDFPLVCGELAVSCSSSMYPLFVKWCSETLFCRTPASSGRVRPWRRRRATVDGQRRSPLLTRCDLSRSNLIQRPRIKDTGSVGTFAKESLEILNIEPAV
jgi:hypothetical protein